MDISVGEVLVVEDGKYIVLDKVSFNNKTYIFVNKLDSEENPTNDLYAYEVIDDEISMVMDKKILDFLLPKFEKNIEKMINNMENME